MAGEEQATRSTRPKRQCARSSARPKSTHYIGYVDDEETPEAIEAKFAAMEQVMALLGAAL